MEAYEVFRRAGHRDPFEHAGTVTASDPEMALLLAKECFVRRREAEHLWVVRRRDIHSFKDETILEVAGDKIYRFPQGYRDVVSKRDKAKRRVAGARTGERGATA